MLQLGEGESQTVSRGKGSRRLVDRHGGHEKSRDLQTLPGPLRGVRSGCGACMCHGAIGKGGAEGKLWTTLRKLNFLKVRCSH